MAVTNVYQLRTNYTYFGADCSNVFYYLQNLGSGGAAILVSNFVTDVLPAILDMQSEAVTMVSVEAVNFDDLGDFALQLMTTPGDRTGEGLSNFYAWGYLYTSTNRAIRSGGKRFAGVSELDVASGMPTAAMLTILNASAVTLAETVVGSGGGDQWFPVLHTEGNIKTAGAPLSVILAGISFARLTTQNTRKTF